MTTPLPPGTRVVEWGERASTAWCGKVLASLGADVIKVEAPQQGDPVRYSAPLLAGRTGPESSARFAYLNLGKRGITLDPGASRGQPVFDALLKVSDILICDSDRVRRAGPDNASERIAARFPHLIVVHLSPYGLSGPKADWAGTDLTLHHAGGEGIMVADGLDDYDRPPVKAAGSPVSYDAGVAAAAMVLAVVFDQVVSGSEVGEHIEVAEFDVVLGTSRMDVPRWANEAELETRETQVLRYNIVRCADGLVDMMTPEDGPWARLKALLSDAEWLDRPEFSTRTGRDANRPAINAELTPWALAHSAREVSQALKSCGVATEVVLDMDGILQSEQYAYRNFWADVRDPDHVGFAPHLPFLVNGVRWAPERARAPRLGEHTEAVLVGEGLVDAPTFDELRVGGVV